MKKILIISSLLAFSVSGAITTVACNSIPAIKTDQNDVLKDTQATINETSDIAKSLILSHTKSLNHLSTSSLLKEYNQTMNADFAFNSFNNNEKINSKLINDMPINWTNISKTLGGEDKKQALEYNSTIDIVSLLNATVKLVFDQNFKIEQVKQLVDLLNNVKPTLNEKAKNDVDNTMKKINELINQYGPTIINIINRDWSNIITDFKDQIIELFDNGTIPVANGLKILDSFLDDQPALLMEEKDKNQYLGTWMESKTAALSTSVSKWLNGDKFDSDNDLQKVLLFIKMQAYWMEQIKINSQDFQISDITDRFYIYNPNKTNQEFFYEILTSKTDEHFTNFNNYKFSDILNMTQYYKFVDKKDDPNQFSVQRLLGSILGYGYNGWLTSTYYSPFAILILNVVYESVSGWQWIWARKILDDRFAEIINGEEEIGYNFNWYDSKLPNIETTKTVLYNAIRLESIEEPFKSLFNKFMDYLWDKFGTYAIDYIKEIEIQKVMDWLEVDWISVPYLYDLKDQTIGYVYDAVIEWFEIEGYEFNLKNVTDLIQLLLTDTYCLKENDSIITNNTISTLIYVLTQDITKQTNLVLLHKINNDQIKEYKNQSEFINKLIGIKDNEFIDNSIGLMISRIYGNNDDGSYDEKATTIISKAFKGIDHILKWTNTKSMTKFNNEYINQLIDDKNWTNKFISAENYYDTNQDAYIKYELIYNELENNESKFEVTIKRDAYLFNSIEQNNWIIEDISLLK